MMQGMPVFLEETTTCSYIFEWKTVYACQNTAPIPASTTKCDLIDNKFRQYDLSPLQLTKSNWKTTMKDADGSTYLFELNVCGALVSTPELSGDCTNSSAGACQLKPSDKSFAPKSLGTPTQPYFTQNNTLAMDYQLVRLS